MLRSPLACLYRWGTVAGTLLLAVTLPAQRLPDLTGKISALTGTQGRVMWIDGTANLIRNVKVNGQTVVQDFTTTRAGVLDIVQKCKRAGVNTLVVDVKPLSGQTLYNSRVAPRMREWRGRAVPDFDVLAAFIEEGHKAGLKVEANINTLSEGHKYFNVGLAYQNPDWQSIVYTVQRGLVAADSSRLPVRVTAEPGDQSLPLILSDEGVVEGEAHNTMVGLENFAQNSSRSPSTLGKQLNLALSADNRVLGVIDSGLLGDDPLSAPEDGWLITSSRPADREWAGQHLRPGQRIRFDLQTARTPIAKAPSERVSCFVNPLHPEARKHVFDVVREIVTNYDIDGLVLDRCRYSNLYNDFSDLSRERFSRWIGRPVNRWPEDIFAFGAKPGDPMIQGPLYKQWLEFRATVIRELVGEIARMVRSLKPNIALGAYVGSWYPQYYEVGVNWGSASTNLRYSWFTPQYPETGYIEFLDWLTTGCYYPNATREDARRQGQSERMTVEYTAELSRLAVANGAFVYPGLNVPDYAGKPDAFRRALETCTKQGQGWMLFDLTYIEEYNWWPILEQVYAKETPAAPHLDNDLLSIIRTARDAAQ